MLGWRLDEKEESEQIAVGVVLSTTYTYPAHGQSSGEGQTLFIMPQPLSLINKRQELGSHMQNGSECQKQLNVDQYSRQVRVSTLPIVFLYMPLIKIDIPYNYRNRSIELPCKKDKGKRKGQQKKSKRG